MRGIVVIKVKGTLMRMQVVLPLTSGSNNIYLGSPGVASESSTLRLGNVQTRAFIKGVTGVPVSGLPVTINSAGQLGVQPSSARYK